MPVFFLQNLLPEFIKSQLTVFSILLPGGTESAALF